MVVLAPVASAISQIGLARRQQAGDFQPLAPGLQLGQRADIPQQVRHARRSLARGQGPASALNAGSLRQLCSVNVLGAIVEGFPGQPICFIVLSHYNMARERVKAQFPLIAAAARSPGKAGQSERAKNLGGGAGVG